MTPRSVFITGASSGLGRGLALHYARAGATVHAAARRERELESLAEEAPEGRLVPIKLDVTDADRLVRAIREAESASGGALDLVIANAGIGSPSSARKMDWTSVKRTLDVNVSAACVTVAAALPAMVAREAGQVVAVLSEGDPLFFGSYMHIHVRLMNRFRTEVIPGVTSMSGCWSAAGLPIVQGDDVLTVLPGTLPETELVRRLRQNEPTVVMKLGRNLPKVRRSLIESNRLANAIYVERGTMQDERMMPLAEKSDDSAPYFAIVLVTNHWWQS